jgi:FkbM family methyltransferase
MNAKQQLKKALSGLLWRVGKTGCIDRAERVVVERVTPYLLDPEVLGQFPIARQLRGLPTTVLCNPHNVFHRAPFWLGRLHERELDLLLRLTLRVGDMVVDVGANYGHVTFLAAALVGASGRVHAVEPHAQLAALIRQHAIVEQTPQVTVHQVAISNRNGETVLRVDPRHTGASWVAEGGDSRDDIRRFSEVQKTPMRRGDDQIRVLPMKGRLVLKIDVEGHELSVVQGMPNLLSRADLVVMEVTPEWNGGAIGVEVLFNAMQKNGFVARTMRCSRGKKLVLTPCTSSAIRKQTNVLFARQVFLAEARSMQPHLMDAAEEGPFSVGL